MSSSKADPKNKEIYYRFWPASHSLVEKWEPALESFNLFTEPLKKKGNEHVAKKEWAEALECYQEALEKGNWFVTVNLVNDLMNYFYNTISKSKYYMVLNDLHRNIFDYLYCPTNMIPPPMQRQAAIIFGNMSLCATKLGKLSESEFYINCMQDMDPTYFVRRNQRLYSLRSYMVKLDDPKHFQYLKFTSVKVKESGEVTDEDIQEEKARMKRSMKGSMAAIKDFNMVVDKFGELLSILFACQKYINPRSHAYIEQMMAHKIVMKLKIAPKLYPVGSLVPPGETPGILLRCSLVPFHGGQWLTIGYSWVGVQEYDDENNHPNWHFTLADNKGADEIDMRSRQGSTLLPMPDTGYATEQAFDVAVKRIPQVITRLKEDYDILVQALLLGQGLMELDNEGFRETKGLKGWPGDYGESHVIGLQRTAY